MVIKRRGFSPIAGSGPLANCNQLLSGKFHSEREEEEDEEKSPPANFSPALALAVPFGRSINTKEHGRTLLENKYLTNRALHASK